MDIEKLKPNNWYFCFSMTNHVKFVEICDIGIHKGMAYVEFMTENDSIGGAYVYPSDLSELI